MSKLARALALAAMLAAMNLAGMIAVAHAYPVDPATDLRATAQQQSTGDATLRRVLVRERFSSPTWRPPRWPARCGLPSPAGSPAGSPPP
jgi:hypothetical protein